MKLFFVMLSLVTAGALRAGEITLLNVSYDPTREFYAEYNEAFAKHWKEKKGEDAAAEAAEQDGQLQRAVEILKSWKVFRSFETRPAAEPEARHGSQAK
jgi:ABC-type sulfate transport system substrate-binding protein